MNECRVRMNRIEKDAIDLNRLSREFICNKIQIWKKKTKHVHFGFSFFHSDLLRTQFLFAKKKKQQKHMMTSFANKTKINYNDLKYMRHNIAIISSSILGLESCYGF